MILDALFLWDIKNGEKRRIFNLRNWLSFILIPIFPKNISVVGIIITKQRSVWCSRDSRGIVICIWIKFYISGLKFQWNLRDGYSRMLVRFSRGRLAQRQGIGDAKTTDECRWTFRNQFALIFQDGIRRVLRIFVTRSMKLKIIIWTLAVFTDDFSDLKIIICKVWAEGIRS